MRVEPGSVASAGSGLRYRAFFEALGSAADGSAEWRSVLAGLVTLRYFDAWVERAVCARELASERQAVECAIAALSSEMPERIFLGGLVGASDAESEADVTRAGSLLLAYGRSLQHRSRWSLAVAVYARAHQLCASAADNLVTGELAASAAIRMGQCHRRLGQSDAADAAYRAAATLGRACDDRNMQLRARLGLANVAADRGNLRAADELLAALVLDAGSPHHREVRAYAWHDRAAVAHRRGQTAESIEYAYEAWSAAREPAARERILADLASIALAAGYREAARDANTVLAATAKEQWIRWVATINLMEIATLDRSEAEFTRRRRTLARALLPPALQAEFAYFGALGDYAFGRPDAAVEELQQAVRVAEAHGLGEMVFRAEGMLARVREGAVAPPASVPMTAPGRLARVTHALSTAKMLATVAG